MIFDDGKNSMDDLVPDCIYDTHFVFDKNLLDKVISKASVNLGKISNVDAWVDDLKAEGI